MGKIEKVKPEYYHGVRKVTSGKERVVLFGAFAVTIPKGYAYCANSDEMKSALKTTCLRIVPIEDEEVITLSPYGLAGMTFNFLGIVNPIYPAKKNTLLDMFSYVNLESFSDDSSNDDDFNLPHSDYETIIQNADIWVLCDMKAGDDVSDNWKTMSFMVVVRDANAYFNGVLQIDSDVFPNWKEKAREVLGWVGPFNEDIDAEHPLLHKDWLFKGLSGNYGSYGCLQIPIPTDYYNDTDNCDDKRIKERWISSEDVEGSDEFGRVYILDSKNINNINPGDPALCFKMIMKATSNKYWLHTGKIDEDQVSFFTNPECRIGDSKDKTHTIFGADVVFFVLSRNGFHIGQLSFHIRNSAVGIGIDEAKYDINRIAKEFLRNIIISSDNETRDAINKSSKTDISDDISAPLTDTTGFTELTSDNCKMTDKKINYFPHDDDEVIEAIIVPEGIEEIGDQVFEQISSLKTVILPKTLKKIGKFVFSECSALTEIAIPYGVQEIGDGAFSACNSLKSVVIPGSVKKVSKWAFSECSSLSEVIISNGVQEIGDCAFGSCESLVKIKLPSSVRKFCDTSFAWCENLRELEVPSSVKEIVEEDLGGYWDDSLVVHTPSGSYADNYFRKHYVEVVND